MTRSVSQDRSRYLAGRLSRRDLVGAGGAALAVSAATAIPRQGFAAQTGAATPAAPAQVLDPAALDAFITDAMARFDVPGAAVAVIQGSQPVLVQGYGVREPGNDAPVDADTVFQLASNTKPMTAFVLGTLVEEGLIAWDTPIVDVLPELQLWDPYPTRFLDSRDILAHRAGFPAFGGDLLAHIGYDRAELLRRLRFLPPASSFRSVAAYSNLGFFIAGEVITRLTGAPWEEAMRERLFGSLGMSRSGPALADRPADGNMSANIGRVDGQLQAVRADDHGAHGSAGSAVSTANDLARWMQMLLDGGLAGGQRVMAEATVREMLEPGMVAPLSISELAPIDARSGFTYGLGWANFHYHGYEVIEKGGALDGVRTVVVFVPALNVGVAVLANLNLSVFPEAIRAFVLEQLLGPADLDLQQQIQDVGVEIDAIFAATPPLPANPVPAAVPLVAFAGVYQNALYGEFRVVVEGEALRLEAGPAGKPAALRHVSHNTFLLDWGSVTSIPGETTFTIGPDGVAIGFENEEVGTMSRVAET